MASNQAAILSSGGPPNASELTNVVDPSPKENLADIVSICESKNYRFVKIDDGNMVPVVLDTRENEGNPTTKAAKSAATDGLER